MIDRRVMETWAAVGALPEETEMIERFMGFGITPATASTVMITPSYPNAIEAFRSQNVSDAQILRALGLPDDL